MSIWIRIASRFAGFMFIMWAFITITFFISHALPGDPVTYNLRESASTYDIQQERNRLQLDLPLLARYWRYLKSTFNLQFGQSIVSGEPVGNQILLSLKSTTTLALASLPVIILLAFPIGIAIAFQTKPATKALIQGITSVGLALPPFVLALMLIMLFSVKLNWLPISGTGTLSHLVLPALSMGIYFASSLSRYLGNILMQELQSHYVLLAKAKGLSSSRILACHIIPNVCEPISAALCLQLGALLSGAVVTEMVFSRPGIGWLLVTGIRQRDYPVIQGVTVTILTIYLIIHIVQEFLAGPHIPRHSHV